MMRHERGFTLIEVLVALGIASFALVALMGRLGASADIQRSLSLHALAMDTARNVLAEERLLEILPADEKQGDIQSAGVYLHWRTWSEKTLLDTFVRRNVAVEAGNEPEVILFMYRSK
ncbi:MAG: type II secretion system minor pseudopilin GspI [Mariprofundaceae bacterium]|nr:type II secretion system minor pseudopilin GspI [Mariprofundaceae bacterium]